MVYYGRDHWLIMEISRHKLVGAEQGWEQGGGVGGELSDLFLFANVLIRKVK